MQENFESQFERGLSSKIDLQAAQAYGARVGADAAMRGADAQYLTASKKSDEDAIGSPARVTAGAAATSAAADMLKAEKAPNLNYRMGTARVPNYKKGVIKVPGKGPATKDSVPAKLAPGEAVLNKAAADNMGRGMIAAANRRGAQQMGMI